MKFYGLYSYIDLIMNFIPVIWAFAHKFLQNQIMRFYQGVHKNAPTGVTEKEMDWLECRVGRWLNILRLDNRISMNVMDRSRLSQIVYDWDDKSYSPETNC